MNVESLLRIIFPVAARAVLSIIARTLTSNFSCSRSCFLPNVSVFCVFISIHFISSCQIECNEPKHLQRLESIRDILARKAATEAKGTTGKPLGIGAGRATRCLKAVQVLLDELARN